MSVNDLTSTVPLVRRTLKEQIEQATVGMGESASDVLVTAAMRAALRSNDEVQIADVREFLQQTRYSRGEGPHKRDESYNQDIHVYCVRQDPEEAGEACWVIWSKIDDILASSIGLKMQIPTLQVGITRQGFINYTYDDARLGYRGHLLMSVSVSAKI